MYDVSIAMGLKGHALLGNLIGCLGRQLGSSLSGQDLTLRLCCEAMRRVAYGQYVLEIVEGT